MTQPAWNTARAILFPDTDGAVGELADLLRRRGVDRLALRELGGASEVVRTFAGRELTGAIDGLLDIDLGDVLIGGWRRYERLRAAGRNTRGGRTEEVELFEHEIEHTYRPRLELTVDGVRAGEVDLGLGITMLLQPLLATVHDGMLAAIGPGECAVTVSVSVAELGPLVERRRTVRTASMVDLRRPVPLVERPPPEPPTRRIPGAGRA